MQTRIQGTTMPVLEVQLDPNDSVFSESGELSWMTQSIQMTTHTQMGGGGGLFGVFKRVVNLRIRSDDRKGLLAKMSETFADVGVNIVQANAKAGEKGAISMFEVEISNVKQLNDVLRAIGNIPGVHSVERV